jgi:hypothetical protein
MTTTDPQAPARPNCSAARAALLLALAFAALLLLPQAARAQSTLTNGLISHWQLDESQGTRFDSKGTNHLSDNNTVTQAAGKLGGAAVFSTAAGNYLSKPDNADLSIQGDVNFTFAGWFYLTSKSSYMGLLAKYDGAGLFEYSLYYDQGFDRLVWMVSNSSGVANQVIASSLGSPALNTWYYVVVWHDASANTINIQINNSTADSAAHDPAGVKDGISAFELGQFAGNTAGLSGRIDSVSFWKRLLTAAERTELWNNGAGKDPTGGAPPPANTGWQNSGQNVYFSAGNVGINIDSPSERLHVVGNGRVTGNLVVDGDIAAKFQDVAEWVPSRQRLAAGTVVVLDPDRNNEVLASTRAYDTGVAGVVSARPGLALGERGEGKVLVATTGRVKVKVDATRAPVKVGDLLVTSGVEGVAMRSVPLRIKGVAMHRPGTIVGKALEPLAGGVGEILVLLSLQ